ncbi:hypothetical protein BZA70DRAFT_271296 [Myxozyma melibiosi]|uniref:U1 small nuclear ribonucleoprotein component SNU71 n=1 Tax=Myxozyma melibiosi TaxID=54550 RepID=A0ABR1FC65_9ASCO
MLTAADHKRLEAAEYPAEFEKPVDLGRVNFSVIKSWIEKEVIDIANGDDIASEYLISLLESDPKPKIKEVQLQLEGFLDPPSLAQKFCKDLWDLLLEAQASESGVPARLQGVEARAHGKPQGVAMPSMSRGGKLEEIKNREIKEAERARELKEAKERAKQMGEGRARSEIKRARRDGSSPEHRGAREVNSTGDSTRIPSRDSRTRDERLDYPRPRKQSTSPRRRDSSQQRRHHSPPSRTRRRSPLLSRHYSPTHSPLTPDLPTPKASHRRTPSPTRTSRERPPLPSRHAEHHVYASRPLSPKYDSYRPSERREERRRSLLGRDRSRHGERERDGSRERARVRNRSRSRSRSVERRNRSPEYHRRGRDGDKYDRQDRDRDGDRRRSEQGADSRQRDRSRDRRDSAGLLRASRRSSRSPPPIPEKSAARSPERRSPERQSSSGKARVEQPLQTPTTSPKTTSTSTANPAQSSSPSADGNSTPPAVMEIAREGKVYAQAAVSISVKSPNERESSRNMSPGRLKRRMEREAEYRRRMSES